jgi:hypothetical protein
MLKSMKIKFSKNLGKLKFLGKITFAVDRNVNVLSKRWLIKVLVFV